MAHRLKICGQNYRIFMHDKIIHADMGILYGLCTYGMQTIDIAVNNVNREHQEETLVHETIHAVAHHLGMKMKEADVIRLASGINSMGVGKFLMEKAGYGKVSKKTPKNKS